MGRLVNRAELSEALGIGLNTVDLWIRDGMPCIKPERRGGSSYQIDMGLVLEWHRQRERQNALGEIASIDEQAAKRRKMAAQAALAELELAKKQGLVVEIADQVDAWSTMVVAAKIKMLGIGVKAGPIVSRLNSAAECQQVITDAVYEALRELNGFDIGEIQDSSDSAGKPESGNPASGELVGAAAAAHGKRMGRRQ